MCSVSSVSEVQGLGEMALPMRSEVSSRVSKPRVGKSRDRESQLS